MDDHASTSLRVNDCYISFTDTFRP
jgi:hypothetical protein